jgi:hypothetical protein
LGKADVAIDAVMKCGDVQLLCDLYVECGKWTEAFKVFPLQLFNRVRLCKLQRLLRSCCIQIAESTPDLMKIVHAKHAAHLVQHDRFEDAMQVCNCCAVCRILAGDFNLSSGPSRVWPVG